MTTHPYVVFYTCRHWVGKPDPHGWGKCSNVFRTAADAESAALRMRERGHRCIRIVPPHAASC
jgi:hypothetical protein